MYLKKTPGRQAASWQWNERDTGSCPPIHTVHDASVSGSGDADAKQETNGYLHDEADREIADNSERDESNMADQKHLHPSVPVRERRKLLIRNKL